MDLFLVYMWLKLDAVSKGIGALIFISVLIGLVCLLVRLISAGEPFDKYCNSEEQRESWRSAHKKLEHAVKLSTLCFLSLGAVATFMPSSKDVAILVGVHYVNKAIETPEAAKVQTLLRLKANEMLDKHIQEATKAASDSKN